MGQDKSKFNDKPRIGALWEKTSKNGKVYWLGNITINGIKEYIVMFENYSLKNDRAPAFNILLNSNDNQVKDIEKVGEKFEDKIDNEDVEPF